MKRIVVVGSINADIVTRVRAHPAPGETVVGESLAVLPGGKGANQAVAAARLGGDVAMVGAVGSDEFAAPATCGLTESGVDVDAVDRVPGETGVAIVTVAADGENAIVVVPGANGTVDGSAVGRHRALIGTAGVVVVQGEIPRSGAEAAAHAARGRLVLNLAPVIDMDAEVLRRSDPLVVNEHEARGALALLGGHALDDTAGDGHEAVARALAAAGVRSVVVTLGPAGALVATPGADGTPQVEAVPAPLVDAVDTTGAGDAFVGALALRLARGEPLLAAARFAARVGAFTVTGRGTQASYPSVHDPLPDVP